MKFKARVDVKSPWIAVNYSCEISGVKHYSDSLGRIYPETMVEGYEPMVFGQVFQVEGSPKNLTFLKYKDMDHVYAVEEGCKDNCIVDIANII